MAFYVKVAKEVAEKTGYSKFRNELPDGSFLLWQEDVNSIGIGYNFDERVQSLGGVTLTSKHAKREQDGQSCLAVNVPKKYGGTWEPVVPKEEGGNDE